MIYGIICDDIAFHWMCGDFFGWDMALTMGVSWICRKFWFMQSQRITRIIAGKKLGEPSAHLARSTGPSPPTVTFPPYFSTNCFHHLPRNPMKNSVEKHVQTRKNNLQSLGKIIVSRYFLNMQQECLHPLKIHLAPLKGTPSGPCALVRYIHLCAVHVAPSQCILLPVHKRLDCRNAKLYYCNMKLSTASNNKKLYWLNGHFPPQMALANRALKCAKLPLHRTKSCAKTYKNLYTIISQDKCVKVYDSVFCLPAALNFQTLFSHRQPFKCASDALLYFRPNCVLSIYRFVTVFPLQFCFARPALP